MSSELVWIAVWVSAYGITRSVGDEVGFELSIPDCVNPDTSFWIPGVVIKRLSWALSEESKK